MYVCICNAVRESQVREAIADGTNTWKKLCCKTKLATQCGKCAIEGKAFFDQELAKAQAAKAETN